MAEYKTIPETVYIGMAIPKTGFKKSSLLPEIKIRFNKSRYNLGKVTGSKDVVDVLRKIVGRRIETQEFFIVLYLSRSMEVIGFNRHTIGTQHATIVDIKMIAAGGIKILANAVIICHNHPSGNLTPSEADKKLTEDIKKELNYSGIRLLDHIIITRDGFFSFADEKIPEIGHYPGCRGLSGMSTNKDDFDNCIG